MFEHNILFFSGQCHVDEEKIFNMMKVNCSITDLQIGLHDFKTILLEFRKTISYSCSKSNNTWICNFWVSGEKFRVFPINWFLSNSLRWAHFGKPFFWFEGRIWEQESMKAPHDHDCSPNTPKKRRFAW